jgi:hypothetical protein
MHYVVHFSLFSWDVLCITHYIFLSSHEMYYALQGTFFSLLMRCIMHDMVLSVIWIVRDKWEIPSFGFWSTWAHSFGFVLFSFVPPFPPPPQKEGNLKPWNNMVK